MSQGGEWVLEKCPNSVSVLWGNLLLIEGGRLLVVVFTTPNFSVASPSAQDEWPFNVGKTCLSSPVYRALNADFVDTLHKGLPIYGDTRHNCLTLVDMTIYMRINDVLPHISTTLEVSLHMSASRHFNFLHFEVLVIQHEGTFLFLF